MSQFFYVKISLLLPFLKPANVMIWVIIFHGVTGDQSSSIKSKYDKVIQTNPLGRVIIVTLHMNEVLNICIYNFHSPDPTNIEGDRLMRVSARPQGDDFEAKARERGEGGADGVATFGFKIH